MRRAGLERTLIRLAGIEDLREKREEVNRSIAKDEEEKGASREPTQPVPQRVHTARRPPLQLKFRTTCAS